jgi:protein-disulfide isomerase
MPSTNTEGEIQELEGRLKTLKQRTRGNWENTYMIPVAILIAGVLIAGAVFYSGSNTSISGTAAVGDAPSQPSAQPNLGSGTSDNIKPVNSRDHIRGNPDAPVKIVEFSDTECPFCKRFHATMQEVMNEYGKNGSVAWVYRHFPLDQLHSKARREAAAAELAGELGGNEAFWAYLDKIFEISPTNDGLDLSLLAKIAEDIGLPRKPFDDLVSANDIRGGKYADRIEADYQDVIASGGSGTPYSVVIAPNGKTFAISGAQPYAAVKSIIDLALKEK